MKAYLGDGEGSNLKEASLVGPPVQNNTLRPLMLGRRDGSSGGAGGKGVVLVVLPRRTLLHLHKGDEAVEVGL